MSVSNYMRWCALVSLCVREYMCAEGRAGEVVCTQRHKCRPRETRRSSRQNIPPDPCKKKSLSRGKNRRIAKTLPVKVKCFAPIVPALRRGDAHHVEKIRRSSRSRGSTRSASGELAPGSSGLLDGKEASSTCKQGAYRTVNKATKSNK